jgi:rfaE bifunctional protein nucleotidyltransferase chain/domain
MKCTQSPSVLKKSSFQEFLKAKTIEPGCLEATVKNMREGGRSIATLNGSFDLLHAGHLEIIYQASLQAECLLVALNSDKSIQGYKNPDRPIIPLEYRIQMMAGLEFVDFVTWFDELDPRQLLDVVKPDVHVNGAEYGIDCIESETVKKNGGRLHIVQLVPGLSTSNIIRKIRTLP